ncbi:hypothetical protein M0R45_031333 [Rubus argutus]|uniref:Uncharacterized protein n=1 Tax=Rubus argutus TaxID=59490 RepID=A0AAW1WD98_RUBAR
MKAPPPPPIEELRRTTPKKEVQHPATETLPRIEPPKGSPTAAANQAKSTYLRSREQPPDPKITTKPKSTRRSPKTPVARCRRQAKPTPSPSKEQ